MTTPLRCLIVEDSEDDARLVLRQLRDGGFEVTAERVDTPEAMSAALARQPWDIIISDYKMPRFSGTAALELLKASGLDLPFIIVSGTIGEELAVEAIKAGAHDYLMKDRLARLVPAVQRKLRDALVRRERQHSEETLRLQAAALAAAANAIVIADRDGTVVWVNSAFTTLTGYPLAEAVGKNPRDLVKSGQQERAFYENLWQTIVTGHVWHGELVNRRKDGSVYPEEQTITPLRDAAGAITHFIAIKEDLTERRAAEYMMQTSRRQFQAVFEQAAVGMVIAEGEGGRIVNANRRFCEMVGRTAAELIHLTSGDITHPDDIPEDWKQMELINRGVTRSFSHEKRFQKKDGAYLWVRAFVAPVDPTDAGSKLRIGVFADITERKDAEASLRASEERYRMLFAHAPDGIFAVTSTGTVKALNQAFETITGWPPAEWLGRPFLDLIHPDDQAIAGELFRLALRGEPTPTAELRVRTAAGGSRVVEFTGFSCQLSDGAVEVHGIGRDITARKAAERQLREQAEIISSAHEGVMIVNLDNQITLWNRGAERMFGWTAAEALGHPPDDVLGTGNPGAVSTLRAAVERDGFWNGELRGQTRDGRTLILDCRTTLVRDAAGRPRARLNFFADITEKKLLEEKFLQVQRLESIGMLAAGIAHDLNNVLAPIVFAGPLLRGSLSTPRELKIVDALEQSAARGTGLVKQILGFARSTTGEFQATQVKHIARDIIDVMEETFPKSIQLEQQIPSNLWLVQANATQIHQVLMNLCVNARDAMPEGGTLRLVAANRRLDAAEAGAIHDALPGAWLVLEVADTGPGIPPEVLERIWSPFFTTKAVGKGTGLGLSTVRGIVLSHHGFVELDTEVGRGSIFRVFLPAIENEPPRDVGAMSPDIPRGRDELILVVDDDAAIRRIICQILEIHGYRSVSCADGEEAITLFTARPGEIPLVITDVDMPRLGGVALAQALAQISPGIRLLAMSGLSRSETGVSDVPTIQNLAHAFLLKPFKPEDLLGAVHRLLHPSA